MTKQKRGIFRRMIDKNPGKFWFFDLPFVVLAIGFIIYMWAIQ